jgi:hypothetical protein
MNQTFCMLWKKEEKKGEGDEKITKVHLVPRSKHFFIDKK